MRGFFLKCKADWEAFAFLRYDSEPRYSSLAYLYTSLEKQPLTML